MSGFPSSKVDLLQYLKDVLPETSEFRPGAADEPGDDPTLARRGRRLTVPLSTSGVGIFSGQLFVDPIHVTPSPTQVLRKEYSHARDVVVYLSWEVTPNAAAPVEPVVMALVRWGVGGAVYTRMLDVHQHVPKRFALSCHFVEVIALYLDLGESTPNSVDVVASIAEGQADPNFWVGTWQGPGSPTGAQQVTTCPAALLAAAGTLTSLPGGATSAYIIFVDKATAAVGGEPTIAGACTPLLAVGESFSFSEDGEPNIQADFGLQWLVSSTPDQYTALGGGIPLAAVATKVAVS